MTDNTYDLTARVKELENRLQSAFRRISDLENKSKIGITYGPITQVGRCLVYGEYHSNQQVQCPATIVHGQRHDR